MVYPERKDRAPVVIVIHEIFGLTDWIRAVADQFAAEGFIAVEPDFLSGKGPEGKGSGSVDVDTARSLIRELNAGDIVRRLDAAARYATSLPAAGKKFATVGCCWGGESASATRHSRRILPPQSSSTGLLPRPVHLAA